MIFSVRKHICSLENAFVVVYFVLSGKRLRGISMRSTKILRVIAVRIVVAGVAYFVLFCIKPMAGPMKMSPSLYQTFLPFLGINVRNVIKVSRPPAAILSSKVSKLDRYFQGSCCSSQVSLRDTRWMTEDPRPGFPRIDSSRLALTFMSLLLSYTCHRPKLCAK